MEDKNDYVLPQEDRIRYSRQILLDEIGEEGQRRLFHYRVLIIGAGGLGSPAALYLAAAGVGSIGIADGDLVELSNLQRQIAHSTADLGRSKAVSAAESMKAIAPTCRISTFEERIDENNIRPLIRDYDFVIDATDNFESKFLINDACVAEKKPFCHGAVSGFKGQLMTYVPGAGPCYRCVFKSPPVLSAPDINDETVQNVRQSARQEPRSQDPFPALHAADTNDQPSIEPVESAHSLKVLSKSDLEERYARHHAVIGPAPGVIGTMQAAEAIKYAVGAGILLTGYLLTADLLTMEFHKIRLPQADPHCPACGAGAAAEPVTG